jgi:hypothetical protein
VSQFVVVVEVQTKQGISSIELGRRLGVTQTTAWKIKHKLKQLMLERDATKRLAGRIEIDDAYLGGERSGGRRGRGAPGKTPFVRRCRDDYRGKPVRLKLRRVTSFCAISIAGFAKRSLDPNCSVVSDGLQCFASVADAGCAHQVVKTGSGPRAARTPAFKWVNTALGNIKAAITGTYRAINSKHVPRLDAFAGFGPRRPPSWSDLTAQPTNGCLCSCCGNRRWWWCEAVAAKAWRCWTCHPPDHLNSDLAVC